MLKLRQFGHKWVLYCVFFIAHARNGCISTSGLVLVHSRTRVVVLDFRHYTLSQLLTWLLGTEINSKQKRWIKQHNSYTPGCGIRCPYWACWPISRGEFLAWSSDDRQNASRIGARRAISLQNQRAHFQRNYTHARRLQRRSSSPFFEITAFNNRHRWVQSISFVYVWQRSRQFRRNIERIFFSNKNTQFCQSDNWVFTPSSSRSSQ